MSDEPDQEESKLPRASHRTNSTKNEILHLKRGSREEMRGGRWTRRVSRRVEIEKKEKKRRKCVVRGHVCCDAMMSLILFDGI